MQSHTMFTHPVTRALLSALVALPLAFAAYFVMEPAVAKGQSTADFTVTQEIEGEIAFEVAPNNVTMDPAIPGLTGGTSNGTSTFAVSTNNSAGYTVTIQFADGDAMQFEGGAGFIPNFSETIQNEFEANVDPNRAAFGLTIDGPNVATPFLVDGSTCGTGTSNAENCWRLSEDATDEITVVDSNNATVSAGESYNLHFRVHVNENPDPSLELGFYTATATLTALEKP